MQVRRVRVQIDTASLRVRGILQLPTEGYRSRTTDFMNSHDTGFFALTDAELTDGAGTAQHAYVAIGARHIVALVELEDLGVHEDDLQMPPLGSVTASAPPPANDV